MTIDGHEADQEEKASGSGFVRLVPTDLFENIVDTDYRNQRARRAESVHSGNSQFDYGFAVGIGRQAGESERSNTHETLPRSARTDYTATTHTIDEEYEITLDPPAVDLTELSAGIDSDARDRTYWRGHTARFSFSFQHQICNVSSRNDIQDGRLYGRGAK